MAERHQLILCADDFGLSPAIDDGILTLATAGRLTATGCMVAGPAFVADAARLKPFADRIDIGLHFALTDLAPLGAMPRFAPDGRAPTLGSILARALTGRLDYREIKAEIGRQVAAFRTVFGRGPDFVDGHQHVHVLPTVRRALLDGFADGTLDPAATWIRDCSEAPWAIVRRGIEIPKALFISGLSAGLKRAANARGIRVNDGFRGITGFDRPYRELFLAFLDGPGRRPLVMCHPAVGEGPLDANDPIAPARRREFGYLSSEAFAADLAARGLGLVRFGEIGD